MAYSDRELLARIVQCEAGGEGDNGMKAVATVIMNRVNVPNGEYARVSQGGNIRNIIYQQGQFDCARETIGGRYNSQNIYNMNPTDIHYEIADWALAGNKISEVGECLWFLNPYTSNCGSTFPYNGSGTLQTRIGQHCFYKPTSLYARNIRQKKIKVRLKLKERMILLEKELNEDIRKENRQTSINSNSPDIITNNMYTPAFLREQIGKLVRIEFLIGTDDLVDRVGILEDVGISYVLLRSIESGNLLYCDIYSIKFVVIAERPYRPDKDFQI